jgi:hypothetical protein
VNLIQIVEDRQAELETELRMCREILVILRGARNKAKTGPIVYGNGYKGGRVTKPASNHGGARPHKDQLVVRVREIVKQALHKTPSGLTTAQMKEILGKSGIQIGQDTNPIHNALRGIPGVVSSPVKLRSGPKTYTLKGDN